MLVDFVNLIINVTVSIVIMEFVKESKWVVIVVRMKSVMFFQHVGDSGCGLSIRNAEHMLKLVIFVTVIMIVNREHFVIS